MVNPDSMLGIACSSFSFHLRFYFCDPCDDRGDIAVVFFLISEIEVAKHIPCNNRNMLTVSFFRCHSYGLYLANDIPFLL